MKYANKTVNYVWNEKDILGTGATSSIFKGYDKNSGEEVAVKTFGNYKINNYPSDLKQREFEVLRKISHENIVKLLALESDVRNDSKVIIMELCRGGSVFAILNQPENSYGLPQSDVLLILAHLTAGIKYLRKQNIVHRDIKPDNIMKYISDDNQIIYKLVDFGTARELTDNEEFYSICGTEEYVHPRFYKYAVLQQPRTTDCSQFTAVIDLWSIGVTIYQIITGNLPFRAYKSRRNRDIMGQIYSKLNNQNVISGVQLEENGEIIYSDKLPITCHICAGLKSLIEPLLVSLFKIDIDKMLTYQRFFDQIDMILNKKIINVFFMNTMEKLEMFLDCDQKFHEFGQQIKAETMVNETQQILITNNNHLIAKVGVAQTVDNYPNKDSIYLYDLDVSKLDVKMKEEKSKPQFPKFQTNISIENDYRNARITCSTAHEYKRRIINITNANILMNNGVQELIETYKIQFVNLMRKAENFRENLKISMEFSVNSTNQDIENLNIDFMKTATDIDCLYRKYVLEDLLSLNWKSMLEGKKLLCQTRAIERSEYLVKCLTESWLVISGAAKKSFLEFEDEQFLCLEKIKIDRNVNSMKNLYNNEVMPMVKVMSDYFSDWFKSAQLVYMQSDYLKTELNALNQQFTSIRNDLAQAKSEPKIDQSHIQQEIKFRIRSFNNVREDIKDLLNDNTRITRELQEITNSAMSVSKTQH